MRRAESPGLWALAWRRFCRDRVGVVSFAVALFFFVLMAASGLHLIAGDWDAGSRRQLCAADVLAAPDSADAHGLAATRPAAADIRAAVRKDESDIADPLADVLAEIRRESEPARPP